MEVRLAYWASGMSTPTTSVYNHERKRVRQDRGKKISRSRREQILRRRKGKNAKAEPPTGHVGFVTNTKERLQVRKGGDLTALQRA